MVSWNSEAFIVDACVLIDFGELNLATLSLLSEEVAAVNVSWVVLEEEISKSLASKILKSNISVVEPTTEQLTAAEKLGSKGLSLADKLNVQLALDYSYCCITNDKAQRKLCSLQKIPILWGLEPMKILTHRKLISKSKAKRVAKHMQERNSYITETILLKYFNEIDQI